MGNKPTSSPKLTHQTRAGTLHPQLGTIIWGRQNLPLSHLPDPLGLQTMVSPGHWKLGHLDRESKAQDVPQSCRSGQGGRGHLSLHPNQTRTLTRGFAQKRDNWGSVWDVLSPSPGWTHSWSVPVTQAGSWLGCPCPLGGLMAGVSLSPRWACGWGVPVPRVGSWLGCPRHPGGDTPRAQLQGQPRAGG